MENENKAQPEQEIKITPQMQSIQPTGFPKEEWVTLPTTPIDETDEELMEKLGMDFNQFQQVREDRNKFLKEAIDFIMPKIESQLLNFRPENLIEEDIPVLLKDLIAQHSEQFLKNQGIEDSEKISAYRRYLTKIVRDDLTIENYNESQNLSPDLNKEFSQLSNLRREIPMTEEMEQKGIQNITDEFVKQINKNPFFRYLMDKKIKEAAEAENL